MSMTHQSNYDKYGYTKISMEMDGKSAEVAESWVCKIPLHNADITSLEGHRIECKLEGAKMKTSEWNTDIGKCFICNEASGHCVPITTESKHTKTRFDVFIRQFLNDNKSEPNIHDGLDSQMMCDKCIDRINEYDLASLTAERVAKEMCEILRKNKNALCKERDDVNHSEDVLAFDVKAEIEEIEVDCSLVDGNDFIDFDCASTDESDSEKNTESKSTQGKSSNASPKMKSYGIGNDSNTSETKWKDSEMDDILLDISSAKSYSVAAEIHQNDTVLTKRIQSENSVNRAQQNDGDKSLQCVICEKNFSLKKNLVQHMKLHTGQSDYQCDQCGKSFTRKSSLTKHTNVHLKQNPYECCECLTTFRTLKEFKEHRNQHKSDFANNTFNCSICNWDARDESVLIEHVQMHEGLAPLQCVICKKVLAHKRNIKPHMRLHTGEKVYQCERCGKEFFHRSSFLAHMRYGHDGL